MSFQTIKFKVEKRHFQACKFSTTFIPTYLYFRGCVLLNKPGTSEGEDCFLGDPMQQSFKGKPPDEHPQQPGVEREAGGLRGAVGRGSVTDASSDVFDGMESDMRGL